MGVMVGIGDIVLVAFAERRLRSILSCALQFRIAAVIEIHEEGNAAEMDAVVLEVAPVKGGGRDVIVLVA